MWLIIVIVASFALLFVFYVGLFSLLSGDSSECAFFVVVGIELSIDMLVDSTG